jgi:hydroxyethylthiazole kinase-like uncharacterized protein yjeF
MPMADPHPLYSVADLRRIEQAALAALPSHTLMQRAGAAAAESALQLLAGLDRAGRVLLLAGPGNNGGDALQVAAQLDQAGFEVCIALLGDPGKLPADAQQAWQLASAGAATFLTLDEQVAIAHSHWDLVIDGLFGIGLARAIDGRARELVETVNALRCPVLALDVPSGLDADNGTIVGGSAGAAIRASHTITFIGDKPGLHTADGRDLAGEIRLAPLQIAPQHFSSSRMQLNCATLFAHALHPRLQNSHKGSYGDVAILGGASGMTGAAILAARTAAKCGAGRVFIASLDATPAYDSAQPELMCRRAQEMDFSQATLVAGPGLGTSREAHDALAGALGSRHPLLLDADALNLLALETGLQQKLRARRHPTILTPHPLEAARLLDSDSAQVQADRLAAARTLAERFNAIVVLKGSGTVIAAPGGNIVINPTGNPALATAGSGDVLSGLCGALLAQGWPTWEAALAAVWLHGQAADDLVAGGTGPIGVTASELIPAIRDVLNRLLRQAMLSR